MNSKLTKEYTVPLSACDNTSGMSFAGIVDLFMDMATQHAKELNVGGDKLKEKNMFWVASKTMVKVHRSPVMHDRVVVSTWPEKPQNIRCNRFYTIEKQGDILVEGKNEWSVLSTDNMRPQKVSNIYPEDFVHLEDTVCDVPFSRPDMDFSECEEILSYKVASGDIDLSQHMNNVAYIRAFFSAFSCKEIEEMDLTSLEIIYRIQCFEGEVLSIRKRTSEDGMELGAVKEDGKCAAYLKLK